MPRSDAELILNWQSYPLFPLCPVKHTERRDQGMPLCGIVVAHEMKNRGKGMSTDPFHVYHVGVYGMETGPLLPQLEGVEKDTYHSIEEMLAAGWVVD